MVIHAVEHGQVKTLCLEKEFGSLNAVYARLEDQLQASQLGSAEVVPTAGEAAPGRSTRAGEVEIITATTSLVAAVAPIVIAWFQSRHFDVEKSEETRADGTRIVKTRIRRGVSS